MGARWSQEPNQPTVAGGHQPVERPARMLGKLVLAGAPKLAGRIFFSVRRLRKLRNRVPARLFERIPRWREGSRNLGAQVGSGTRLGVGVTVADKSAGT